MIDMTGITIWPANFVRSVVIVQEVNGETMREACLAHDHHSKGWRIVNDDHAPFPEQWDAICYVVERWRRWDAEDAEAADALVRADNALSKSSPRAALRRRELEP